MTVTRGGYAKAICEQQGFPWTTHTRRALQAWFQSEGGSAWYNPTNTTMIEPGAWNYNNVGVKNYPDKDTGLKAVKDTFRSPGQGYDRIITAFKRNDSARDIVQAIGSTNWGTSSTLLKEVVEWIARVDWVLRWLEQKHVSPT